MSESLWSRLSRRWGRGQSKAVQQRLAVASSDPRKSLHCKVLLLDNTDLTLDIPKHATGADLFDRVTATLELEERDYFGLQFMDHYHVQVPLLLSCFSPSDSTRLSRAEGWSSGAGRKVATVNIDPGRCFVCSATLPLATFRLRPFSVPDGWPSKGLWERAWTAVITEAAVCVCAWWRCEYREG